jgi:hypothetical protein
VELSACCHQGRHTYAVESGNPWELAGYRSCGNLCRAEGVQGVGSLGIPRREGSYVLVRLALT